MLSGLISCHEQSSVLLHQATTFKELLSLVFYRRRAVQCKVSLTFTFIHQVTLTFEDADVPPSTAIWWSRAELHKVTLTFTFMHQVVLTFEDADVHSAEFNWEGSGYEIWALEHWGIYVDWCVLLLLLLLNVVVLVVHLWLWINNYSWTRTTTTLCSKNNTNLNKKIVQFM